MIDRLANRSEIFEHCFVQNISANRVGWLENIDFQNLKIALISDLLDQYPGELQKNFSNIVQLQAPEVCRLAESIEQTTFAQLFAQIIDTLPAVMQDSPDLVIVHLNGFFSAWDAPLSIRQSLVEDEDPDAAEFFEPPVDDWRSETNVDPDQLLILQQAFLAQLNVFDICLGVLLDSIDLENQSQVKLALTSSIGYPLGEHLLVGQPSQCLYSESCHIPWLVFNSELEATTFRHQSLNYLTDLTKRFVSSESSERIGSFATENMIIIEAAPSQLAMRTKAWHLIQQSEKVELYTKPDDRWEVNEVSSRCKDVVESFLEIASQIREGMDLKAIELEKRLTSILDR